MSNLRLCLDCKINLPLDKFEKGRNHCKKCRRIKYGKSPLEQRAAQYSTTVEYLLNLKSIQNNLCKICSKDIKDKWRVDHDHSTGKIRGLLCDRCNQGLGLFADEILLLEKAILYLER